MIQWFARQGLARLAMGLLAGALSGCASLSPDAGFGEVRQAVQPHLGEVQPAWVRTDSERTQRDARVAELLARPLAMDDAVQVALLNNPGLQASFQALRIADADLVAASRPPNPGLSFGRLTRGDEVEIERGLHFNLARWLAWPLARQVVQRQQDQARLQAAQAVLDLAHQVRRAYITAVAAEESVRYLGQVRDAAEAAAELARRMAQTGNWSALQQAREQGFHAEAALGLARAEQAQMAAREQLTRLMGLWGARTAFQLPGRLPDLPQAPLALPDAERQAMAQRLDIQAARQASEQLARQLGLTRATRFINVLDLGLAHNSSNEAPRQRGYEITLELPLFDGGDARTAKAEALYMQSVQRTAQMAIDARSEVRQAYLAYRGSHDIARHYLDEIVPLRKRISDENLLRYNGMLIGVFELLADARAQIESVNAAIVAQRDAWLARVALDQALTGRPSPALALTDATAPSAAATAADAH